MEAATCDHGETLQRRKERHRFERRQDAVAQRQLADGAEVGQEVQVDARQVETFDGQAGQVFLRRSKGVDVDVFQSHRRVRTR